jgi:hypothetical protein
MVRVEVAVPVPGVMVAGEKEQFKVLGSPLQESAIELLNEPDCGFAVTVKVPDRPAGIVRDIGDALKDTIDDPPPVAHPGLYLMAPVIWLARLGLPTACTNNV